MSKLLVDKNKGNFSQRYRAYCEEERKWIGPWGTYEQASNRALKHNDDNPTHLVDIVAEQQILIRRIG